MNAERVSTPDGPGAVVHSWAETTWAFGKPRRYAYVLVELDDKTKGRRTFGGGEVKPIDSRGGT